MSEYGWVSLWNFLRQIANEHCAEVEAYWLAVNNGDFYSDELKEAQSELLLEYPEILTGRSPRDLKTLTRARAWLKRQQWKAEVVRLLDHELPRLLKERLASGEYEITARRLADQAEVKLTPRNLAGLTIDIPNQKFIGSAGSYGEIVIRRCAGRNAELPTDAAPQPQRPPGRPSVMHIIEAEMRRRANATPCELMEKLRAAREYAKK